MQNTYQLKDSVLLVEARLNISFPSDLKYDYSDRNGKVIKQYSEGYSKAYHDVMNGMVENQMRSSIAAIGSFWFSAWVDAGQPNLKNLKRLNPDEKERQAVDREEKLFKQGIVLGRDEN